MSENKEASPDDIRLIKIQSSLSDDETELLFVLYRFLFTSILEEKHIKDQEAQVLVQHSIELFD